MGKYELQLDTVHGRISIPFESVTDLEQKLKDLDFEALNKTLRLYVKKILRGEERKVKSLLSGICSFGSDGTLEVSQPPSSKLEMIGLILYAYDPDPVDLQTLSSLASEKNPAAYVGHKKYGKYFRKIGAGLYGLSHEGKVWVTSEVIAQFTKK